MRSRLPTLKAAAATGIGVIVVVLATVITVRALDDDESSLRTVDTPPAEFLYLDAARVPGYLGQIVGGLSETEKRIEASSKDLRSS